jgi:hypothetical protein
LRSPFESGWFAQLLSLSMLTYLITVVTRVKVMMAKDAIPAIIPTRAIMTRMISIL